MLSHVVLITTKDKNYADKLCEGLETLKAIPNISIHFGKPIPSNRPVVDSNYTVGIVVQCKDQEGLTFYAEHPIHLKFVKEYLNDVSIKVYDFE